MPIHTFSLTSSLDKKKKSALLRCPTPRSSSYLFLYSQWLQQSHTVICIWVFVVSACLFPLSGRYFWKHETGCARRCACCRHVGVTAGVLEAEWELNEAGGHIGRHKHREAIMGTEWGVPPVREAHSDAPQTRFGAFCFTGTQQTCTSYFLIWPLGCSPVSGLHLQRREQTDRWCWN